MGEIKTPPASKKYRENYDRVFAKDYRYETYAEGFHRLMVDTPLSYNTDAPLYMSDGKVVMVIKTLDGDIAL
jgi:hypothetical protein